MPLAFENTFEVTTLSYHYHLKSSNMKSRNVKRLEKEFLKTMKSFQDMARSQDDKLQPEFWKNKHHRPKHLSTFFNNTSLRKKRHNKKNRKHSQVNWEVTKNHSKTNSKHNNPQKNSSKKQGTQNSLKRKTLSRLPNKETRFPKKCNKKHEEYAKTQLLTQYMNKAVRAGRGRWKLWDETSIIWGKRRRGNDFKHCNVKKEHC